MVSYWSHQIVRLIKVCSMTLDDPNVAHDEVDDDVHVMGALRKCRCGELLVTPTCKTNRA